jgi:phage shock protein PspC (stress-responsive transcriptional regulator)
MNDTTDTTEPSPTTAPASRPPLRRSLSDRKIAGVAGGLGRYFNIDPLIFRVVLVTLAVFGGSGLLLYAIGWLLVPEDGVNESEDSR